MFLMDFDKWLTTSLRTHCGYWGSFWLSGRRAGEGEGKREGNGEREKLKRRWTSSIQAKVYKLNCVRKVRIDSTKDNVSSQELDLAEIWRFSSSQVCQLLRWTRSLLFQFCQIFHFCKIRKLRKITSNWLSDHKEDHFTQSQLYKSRPTPQFVFFWRLFSSHFSCTPPLPSRHHDTFFTTTCHC